MRAHSRRGPAPPPTGAEGGFDLHMHSSSSDGTLSPSELARAALGAGLEGFSLTDHDSVEGLEEAASSAGHLGLRFLPGIEVSSQDLDREVHVLGYGIAPSDSGLRKRLLGVRKLREDRVAAIVARLRALGIEIGLEEVQAEARGANPGRPHVAAVLLRRGLVRDEKEVWSHFLGRGGAAFVPRPRPAVDEAVAWIREAGGAAVLAHPALGLPPGRIEILLDQGFDGLEVDHPEQDGAMRERLRTLARRRGLICTGGSDSHGERGHRTPVGAERVDGAVVAALERAAAGRPVPTEPSV